LVKEKLFHPRLLEDISEYPEAVFEVLRDSFNLNILAMTKHQLSMLVNQKCTL